MLYQHMIRPLLFRLSDDDPERAHEWAMRLLAAVSSRPAAVRGLRRALAVESPRLHQQAFGLQFPNPVGLAAGFDKNAVALPALAALGFGFLEVGTITARSQPGNPRPRIMRLPKHCALINSMGFNNDGAATVARRLARCRPLPVPLGVSLGKSRVTPLEDAIADYSVSMAHIYPYADYIAVNISSPNTPGLRGLQERRQIDTLLGALTRRSLALAAEHRRARVPLLVKVSPDLAAEVLDDLLDVCTTHAVDGIIAVNTTIRRPGSDVRQRRMQTPDARRQASDAERPGGLSGRPLHTRALEVVSQIYRRTDGRLPIIGVGGIFSADEAYAMIRAGASLVQIYTALVYKGPAVVRAINHGLLRLMARDRVTSLAEVRGTACRSRG